MARKTIAPALASAVAALCVAPAAGAVEELRFGVAAHNVQLWGGEHQSNESGPSIEIEAVGGRLEALRWIWSPRPYGMVSINTQGDTSFAAAGLHWRWRFADRWALEPGLGLAVHDGATDNPYPPGDPRREAFDDEHQILGADVLFRESLALERRVGERGALGVVVEHLSNGGTLFGHDSNQSLNEIAVRYAITLR